MAVAAVGGMGLGGCGGAPAGGVVDPGAASDLAPVPRVDLASASRSDLAIAPPRQVECVRENPGPSLSAVQRCGPPTNRVNLVFIADGYTRDEWPAWEEHVERMSQRILTTASPYDRYRNFINVYRVDLASPQSGIDDPVKGVMVDTVLDGTNSCVDWTRGLCQVNWAKTHAAINAATAGIPVHWRLVALHTTTFLGGTHYPPEGALAVYSTDVNESFNIVTHEGGHGFHRLGDEYVVNASKNDVYAGGEPNWPNLTIDPAGGKWRRWIGFWQPDLGTVGVFEGGMVRYGRGIFRPSAQSRMNHFIHPLDAVGKEEAIQSIYARLRPIDEHRDNASPVEGCDALWLRVVDPAVIRVQWLVGGKPVPGAAGEHLDVCGLGLPSGSHVVRARAWDEVVDHAFSSNAAPHPLDLVRRDLGRLEQSVEWTVHIR